MGCDMLLKNMFMGFSICGKSLILGKKLCVLCFARRLDTMFPASKTHKPYHKYKQK